MAIATYGGEDIFGPQVTVNIVPRPTANQISEFYGVDGSMSQYGGTRGTTFEITGVAHASSFPGINAWLLYMLSKGDGVARSLVDTGGVVWPYVIFKREVQFTGPTSFRESSWIRPYRAIFHGLT